MLFPKQLNFERTQGRPRSDLCFRKYLYVAFSISYIVFWVIHYQARLSVTTSFIIIIIIFITSFLP
ncbi:hypothetical protein F5Y12DRAFT_724744 [Xylaria sp. FL1777]|nr:hypothetical protein F5Y12DRAFT_724744 [Xylaria sp. FL1777]